MHINTKDINSTRGTFKDAPLVEFMYFEAHSLRISHFLRPPAARFLGSLKKKGASLQTKGELVLRCAEVPELFSLHA